jgi:2-amino-4-hydroxy-6-hydroxymethyldihydropteridine diphosphokinase
MPSAWVGLGSNLGDSETVLTQALAALDRLPQTRLERASNAYRTPPWGVTGQPDFLNAVAELSTDLSPHDLLHRLLEIESTLGRVRQDERWGPRVIDLDLLLVDDAAIETPELSLPHPRLHQRAFVLIPLQALAPGLTIPGQGTVAELLEQLPAAEKTDIKLKGPLQYHRGP